jgi:hypothetical protein
MVGKKILLVAILMYAAALGCVFYPNDKTEAAATPAQGLVHIDHQQPFCGVAISLHRVDWIDRYEKTIDEAADDGADTVSLVVDAHVENKESTQIYIDMRMTPTVPQLEEIINHAKARHMRVILMPIVLPDAPIDNEWRGTLAPRDWSMWFDSYRDMIGHYARVAQATGVDVLVVGSELVSSEEHVDEWIQTIKSVRDIYKGQLTYSSNWDRYWKVKFWDYLDFIGMNSYWDLGKDQDASVREIEDNWKKIQSDMFSKYKLNKPVILLEAGWCSLANAATASWDYTQDQLDADPELQRRLYEGFFQSWWANPHLAGMIMWEFTPDGDPTGKGYTPQGKPAEMVMKDWYSKPRWTIGQ